MAPLTPWYQHPLLRSFLLLFVMGCAVTAMSPAKPVTSVDSDLAEASDIANVTETEALPETSETPTDEVEKPPILTKSVTPEMKAYQSALKQAKKQKGRFSLEPLYRKGVLALQSFHPQVEAYGDVHWQDKTYDPEKYFASEIDLLSGFNVYEYEGSSVGMDPNFAYWESFAKTNGTPADIAFFKIAATLYPSIPAFPSYIYQTWDYGGCTLYGENIITPLYDELANFQKKYPNQYKEEVSRYLEDVRDLLDPSKGWLSDNKVCSCSADITSVKKEATQLMKRRPADPLSRQFMEFSKNPNLKIECNHG
jgi:hypothetical protein